MDGFSNAQVRRAPPGALGAALLELVKGVADAPEIDEQLRPRLIEQLAFLRQQIAAPASARRHGLVHAVLLSLEAGVSRSRRLKAQWAHARDLVLELLEPRPRR